MVAASLLIRTSVTPALIRASTDCSVRVAVMSLAPLVVVASMVTETPFFSVPAFFAASCAALMASVTDFSGTVTMALPFALTVGVTLVSALVAISGLPGAGGVTVGVVVLPPEDEPPPPPPEPPPLE